MTDQGTKVTAHLEGRTREPSEFIFSVAVADGPQRLSEEFEVTVDGKPLELEEIPSVHGTRLHRALVHPGEVEMNYLAVIRDDLRQEDFDAGQDILYRRQSRYSESDKLTEVAADLFGDLKGQALIDAIGTWVHDHLSYVPGSSGPLDGAVDTYFSRNGICRDYAHLTVALLRAREFPARLVSVYAPGLSPMDFHAVAEVALDGVWQIVDSTRLAPRQSLVRIATGRDAADTAFLTNFHGKFDLTNLQVTAVALDGLPRDDHSAAISI